MWKATMLPYRLWKYNVYSLEARWFRFPSNNCCWCTWIESLWYTYEDPALWRQQCWIVDQQIWEETTGKIMHLLNRIESTLSVIFCWLRPIGTLRIPGWFSHRTASRVHLLLIARCLLLQHSKLPSTVEALLIMERKILQWVPRSSPLSMGCATFLGLLFNNTSTHWRKTMPVRLACYLHHVFLKVLLLKNNEMKRIEEVSKSSTKHLKSNDTSFVDNESNLHWKRVGSGSLAMKGLHLLLVCMDWKCLIHSWRPCTLDATILNCGPSSTTDTPLNLSLNTNAWSGSMKLTNT